MPISLPAASSLPEVTLRVDDSGTPFGDAPTWSDYSAALETAGDGSPISITRGRQDGQSEPQPATCTFVLDNTSGAYTPGNVAAAAGWDVGAHVNVRETIGATVYDRFDGYVDSIEPSYPGMDWSQVTVIATDVTARLAIGQPLKTMVIEEMLADDPDWLYPLSEAAGSSGAGDISQNGHPPLLVTASKLGPSTLEFGTEVVGFADEQTGVAFDGPSAGVGTSGALSALTVTHQAGDPMLIPDAGGFSWECWFVYNEAPLISSVIMGQFSDYTDVFAMFVLTAAGTVYFRLGSGGGAFDSTPSSSALTAGTVHHLVATVSAGLSSLRLFCDGVDVGTTAAAGIIFDSDSLRRTSVGGLLTSVASRQGLNGTVGPVAQYSTVLTPARVLDHYQAGVGTLVESSDERYARLAGYANVTTGTLPSGEATVGHQNTSGKTITEALQQVARSEGSVSYATGAGALTFQSREARYNASAELTLTAADINEDATTRRDRQGMANEFTATRSGGASQRVVDAAAQLARGRFDGGSLDVVVSTDADARHIAEWEVATRKSPRSRLPSLTVDLLTLADAALVEDILAADLSTLVTVTDLPDQAPDTSMSVFLEGWTETIGVTQWSLTAFTSPDLPQVQTVDDGVGSTDPTAVLDGTFLVAL